MPLGAYRFFANWATLSTWKTGDLQSISPVAAEGRPGQRVCLRHRASPAVISLSPLFASKTQLDAISRRVSDEYLSDSQRGHLTCPEFDIVALETRFMAGRSVQVKAT